MSDSGWTVGGRCSAGEGAGLGRVASRRKAEELIREGRVKVDGIVVREMGTRIDPENAVVHVDGNRITTRSDLVYLALNKERGVLSTMSDDLGRPHIGQMLEDRSERLFHVGRLDMESEGLLLLTNDGDLAHRLTHPSFGVAKTYVVEVPGPIPKDLGRRLRAGVELEDGPAKVDSFDVMDLHHNRAVVEVVIHEGRKHIGRRLLEAVDRPVSRLVRTQIGPGPGAISGPAPCEAEPGRGLAVVQGGRAVSRAL